MVLSTLLRTLSSVSWGTQVCLWPTCRCPARMFPLIPGFPHCHQHTKCQDFRILWGPISSGQDIWPCSQFLLPDRAWALIKWAPSVHGNCLLSPGLLSQWFRKSLWTIHWVRIRWPLQGHCDLTISWIHSHFPGPLLSAWSQNIIIPQRDSRLSLTEQCSQNVLTEKLPPQCE